MALFASNLHVLYMQIYTDVANDFVLISTDSFNITFKNKHAELNCKSKISVEEPNTLVQPITEDIKNRENRCQGNEQKRLWTDRRGCKHFFHQPI